MKTAGPPCACSGRTYEFQAREMGLSFWRCRKCGDSISCAVAYAPPFDRQAPRWSHEPTKSWLDKLIAAAVAEEREACESLVHDYHLEAHTIDHGECVACSMTSKLTALIRARGEAPRR